MRCGFLIPFVFISFIPAGHLWAQSPAESVLREAPTVSIAEPTEQIVHRSGFYGSLGILVAPPILFDATDHGPKSAVMLPIPSPWITLGFRRTNDVSWQASFLLVPLVFDAARNGSVFLSTIGLDIDRISTNRSPIDSLDLRWQVGLRTVGVGINGIPMPFAMGPHAGIRSERPITDNFFLQAWLDAGLLPNFENGRPLVDLRGEIGFVWRSQHRPLTASISLFNEVVGVNLDGAFMTPGIKLGLGWNF